MQSQKTRSIARLGLLFALAMVLSYLESLVTPLLGLMPAIKLGLANIVVMYAVLLLGARPAWALVFLKAVFAFFTRGATAGFLSLCGGGLSLLVVLFLLKLPLEPTPWILSVSAALAHNIGQLCAAAVVLSNAMALAYAPVLLCVGVAVGTLNCWLLRGVMPVLERWGPKGDMNGKTNQ